MQVSRGPVAGFVALASGHERRRFFLERTALIRWRTLLLLQHGGNVQPAHHPHGDVFALGFFLRKKKFSLMIFGVMTAGFLALAIPNIVMR